MSTSILKKLSAAAGVLVLFFIVYLYRQVPRSQAPFADAEARMERIILAHGAKRVELRKQGNAWKVASDGGYFPAEDSQISTLLSGLKAIKIEDEISNRADRAAEYEVTAESGTQVQLFGANETKLAEGLFGKQAPDFAHIYFRYPDKPNVYLASGMIRGELGGIDVNAWRNHQLLDIPETKIQAITIEGEGFTTELVRTSTNVWTMNGKVIDTGLLNALVGTLAHLHVNAFVDPAAYPALSYEGLAYARVTVKGADSSVELRIGALDVKSQQHPVSIGKDNGLAWLPKSIVNSLLQRPSAFPAAKTPRQQT